MAISRIISLLSVFIIQFSPGFMYAQSVIPLYEGEIPNSLKTENHEFSSINENQDLIISRVSNPTLEIFLPPAKKATGKAVIICPGGGYVNLSIGYEGTEVAERFSKAGIAAFVLKYRIPNDSTMIHKEIGPLQDAQRAIQLVRLKAKDWNLDPKQLGIMGFSAGGHLAASAGTHFERNYISNPAHISLRPDFMILIYPVISFDDSIAHKGSEESLLGKNPGIELKIYYSNETQVSTKTPPAFLVHARDDKVVPIENSIRFYDSLQRNHIPSELYLYETGGHGFGMRNKTSSVSWMDLCITWVLGQRPTD